MPTDPRAALTALVAAFERHLEAAAHRRGENDPAVLAAYRTLADAFEDFDDALLDAFDEVTPLEVFHGEDDEFGDDDEGDDEGDDEDDELEPPDADGGAYTGMDDEEYDDASDAKDAGDAPAPAPGATRL